MRLVKRVAVRGFRSVRQADIDELAAYTPLLGRNGTGKSNLFRALNLFFNGVLDEEYTQLDLSRDFPDTLAKKKREVSVKVALDLSGGYDVRRRRAVLASEGIGDELVMQRSWSYIPGTSITTEDDLQVGSSWDSMSVATGALAATALTFLRSIHFRYIPNHVRPTALIEAELPPLVRALVNRLRATKQYREAQVDETMETLSRVAFELLNPLSTQVARGTNQVKGVSANLPREFAELVFSMDLTTTSSAGSNQPTSVQGSGTQSYILFHLLALLDSTERGTGFGWRQSSVWAIEEPESFLHAGLRTRLASDLHTFAQDARRQVFVTTHQDEFVRVTDAAWLAELNSGETTFAKLTARDAVSKSIRLRIATFQHPLLAFPDDPLVLVEGSGDAVHIRAALVAAGIRPRFRVVSIDELGEDYGGGDALLTYLKANVAALKARRESAPVVLLRDWEETSLNAWKNAVAPHGFSTAVQCPESLVNPDLGKSFRGIERYLETSLVESTVPVSDLVPDSVATRYPLGLRVSLTKSRTSQLKRDLSERILSGSSLPGPFLVGLAEWIDNEVAGVLASIPADFFV